MLDVTVALPEAVRSPRDLFAALPPSRVGDAERGLVDEVLADGFGNREAAGMLGRFERAFAERFGVGHAISHNSGSGTMLSALLAAGVGPGDEVIVPTVTMAATAFVVIQAGAVPVFADNDPRTFNIDPRDVRRKLTEHTRAIIPVAVFGLPPDFDPLMEIAREHDLTVIEDDAECFLATYRGRLVGTIGHAASFSFQGSKHMTTAGDGGMVVTDDADYARLIRKASCQGYRTLGGTAGSTMIPKAERQDWAFERHDRMGYNFRMSALQAACGLGQLGRLDLLVAARQQIAAMYAAVIAEERCEWLVPPHVPEGSTHSYWAYPCLLDTEALGHDWRAFRERFIAHGGDGLYGMWTPVHLEPVFRGLAFHGAPDRAPHHDPRYRGAVKSYGPGLCPEAERFRRQLCLFKTSMQTWDAAEAQAEALRATIRSFA